jgi:hypothetical protein
MTAQLPNYILAVINVITKIKEIMYVDKDMSKDHANLSSYT